jgi:hypothetical protein
MRRVATDRATWGTMIRTSTVQAALIWRIDTAQYAKRLINARASLRICDVCVGTVLY